MVAVPADTPVTRPAELTVAIPEALVLHVPPVVAFDKVVVDPTHIEAFPFTTPTVGVEVTATAVVAVALHPLVSVTVTL